MVDGLVLSHSDPALSASGRHTGAVGGMGGRDCTRDRVGRSIGR